MSAAPRPIRDYAPADIDWSRWISVDEAAPLLGRSAGHLRRQCKELERKGLAMHCQPPAPEGGNARWYINRSFDLKLAPGAVGELFVPSDLSRFSQKQRDEALTRKACVMALRDRRVGEKRLQKKWLPELVKQLAAEHKIRISRTSLLRWDSLYRTESDLVQLIDGRGGDQKSAGDPECWDHFAEYFLNPNAPSIRDAWKQTKLYAAAGALHWCSYESCRRQLDDRISPETQAYHRDPALYRSKFAPYIKQDPERFAAGRCWVGDHTQLDFFVRVGKRICRPFLTTFQDWRTRKIVGYVMAVTPSSDTILATLAQGLNDDSNMGGPTEVMIDNGKDFDAWMFHGQTKRERRRRVLDRGYVDERRFKGIYGELGIKVHFSIPYGPNGKARQERWYRTLHEQFDKTMPTYCGSTPSSKPETLNVALKRLHNVPTMAEARDRLGQWIAWHNANADHQIEDLTDAGTPLSPNQAMAQWCTTRLIPKSETAMNMLLVRWEQPVKVGRHGVRITPYGAPLEYGQFNDALARLKGTKQKVYCAYDPDDLRVIRVHDEQMRLITTARANDFGGASDPVGREQVKALMRRQRQTAAAHKQVASSAHQQYLSVGEQIMISDPPEDPTPQTDHFQLRETALDREVNALQKQELRQAAGGEVVAGHDEPSRALPSISELAGDFDAAGDDDQDDDTSGGGAVSPLDFAFDADGTDDADDVDDDDTSGGWLTYREELP